MNDDYKKHTIKKYNCFKPNTCSFHTPLPLFTTQSSRFKIFRSLIPSYPSLFWLPYSLASDLASYFPEEINPSNYEKLRLLWFLPTLTSITMANNYLHDWTPACLYTLPPTAAVALYPYLHLLHVGCHLLGKPCFFLQVFYTRASQPGLSSWSTHMPKKLSFKVQHKCCVLYFALPLLLKNFLFQAAQHLIIFLVVLVTFQDNGSITPSASHLLKQWRCIYFLQCSQSLAQFLAPLTSAQYMLLKRLLNQQAPRKQAP